MTAVFVALGCGFLAARLAWILLRGMLSAPVFQRANYRGHRLPTAGGLIVVAAAVLIEGARTVVGSLGLGSTGAISPSRTLTLVATAGFGLLGAIDDLGAVGSERGFRGHLRSLGEGRLTTGGLKLLGGGFVALLLAGPAGDFGGRSSGVRAFGWLVCDALVIALSANLANLFDRAPGRVTKIGIGCFGLLVVAAAVSGGGRVRMLAGAAVVVGAAMGLLFDDLREHLMLGDTGANAVGGVLGLALVLVVAPATRLVIMIVLLSLNLLSEYVSFSKIIDSIGPLRALDRVGTIAERRTRGQ